MPPLQTPSSREPRLFNPQIEASVVVLDGREPSLLAEKLASCFCIADSRILIVLGSIHRVYLPRYRGIDTHSAFVDC